MLLCAVDPSFCRAGRDDVVSGRDLLRTVRKSETRDAPPAKEKEIVDPRSKPRVVHFPKDRSLGRIKVMDANIIRQIQASHYDALDSVGRHDWHDWMAKAEYLGEAQGDVIIPAGQKTALFLYENAFKDLSPLLHLKPDDLYMLTHIMLPWNANIPLNAKCMQYISHLAGLKELRLYKATATTEGMEHITKLQSLKMLYPPKGLTNKGLSYVAQLESLKRLYFNENKVANEGLKRHLPKLTKLEELTLWSGGIDDAGLVFLADLRKLSFLSLRSGNFTDAGLSHVKKCSSLRILDLMYLPITDVGLKHLSGHFRLENLRLFNTEVTDRGLVYLKSMPSLKKLNVGKRGQKDQITDAGMVHLAQINSLEHLELPGGITDKGMAHIAKLKNLKHLRGDADSDAALRHLSKLQSLEFLHTGSGCTDAGMEDIAKLINLRDLLLHSDSITNEGLAKLRTLTSLERLSLRCKNITIAGLSGLNALRNLSSLQLRDIKQDNLGLDISGLTKLEELSLTLRVTRVEGERVYDVIRDEDLASLERLKNLKWFQIGRHKHSMITDAGVAYLKNLTNMEGLGIGSPYLTDNALSNFTNMKKLDSLTITGNFTDDGLRYLEQLKALQHLKIYSANSFSPIALQRLQDNLPSLSSFTAEQNREIKKMSQTNRNPSTNNTVAPFFATKTLDGKDIKLEDYRGKVVVLHFWATWCRPCVAGTPELKKVYADMKTSFGNDFEMISLSMDDNEESVREHLKKYELTWPQARIGLHSKISSDYGVNDRAPMYFLIGPDGKILLTPESPQIDTKSFIEKVLKNRKIQAA
jgi:peroxiredoxin